MPNSMTFKCLLFRGDNLVRVLELQHTPPKILVLPELPTPLPPPFRGVGILPLPNIPRREFILKGIIPIINQYVYEEL